MQFRVRNSLDRPQCDTCTLKDLTPHGATSIEAPSGPTRCDSQYCTADGAILTVTSVHVCHLRQVTPCPRSKEVKAGLEAEWPASQVNEPALVIQPTCQRILYRGGTSVLRGPLFCTYGLYNDCVLDIWAFPLWPPFPSPLSAPIYPLTSVPSASSP